MCKYRFSRICKELKMTMNMKKRILLGKLGLDAHDNGVIIIAKWLSDAGFEVIYAGLYNTPESLVQSALQEGADAVGCSFLGGEHLYYTRKLMEVMREKNLDRVKVMLGGVIPPEDVDELIGLGVSRVFTPGTLRETIIEEVKELF
jgi:methylmalonyl-CoA mutase C-terminal domain/subunit